MGKIIFVTGTNTGVGKTVLTSMLLVHLRAMGVKALALKPFCSGSRADALLLHRLQSKDISLDEVNPFYFEKPLAPYLAASTQQRKKIKLPHVVAHIRGIAQRCEILVIEGAGGLLVPVGKNWFIRDLIVALDCDVIVVSLNKLGTINHTLLTLHALQERTSKQVQVVFMDRKRPDPSAKTNASFTMEVIDDKVVERIGYLGKNATGAQRLQVNAKRFEKVLARLTGSDNFSNVLSNARSCGEK